MSLKETNDSLYDKWLTDSFNIVGAFYSKVVAACNKGDRLVEVKDMPAVTMTKHDTVVVNVTWIRIVGSHIGVQVHDDDRWYDVSDFNISDRFYILQLMLDLY